MSAPEISTVNQVKWRLQIVDRRWREALDLLRQAAAAPDYLGPPASNRSIPPWPSSALRSETG